jgi:hypothetical protein
VSRLNPAKLHVRFAPGTGPEGPPAPRCYTLTHSDATGDLFLTIGLAYEEKQVAGWYTRFMRDEVLAEWQPGEAGPALHVYCHVSGGLALGPAGWRDAIFRHELPLVLEAFRAGDGTLFESHPALDQAPIVVHFCSHRRRFHRRERWGTLADYRLEAAPTSSHR